MAAPRIFVSSTYYDLRYVRADLMHFERETGFELVLFERGNIPYDGGRSLEGSCLEEIEKCDIIVSIIGGRLGTLSDSDPRLSISQKEVRHAVELGRQMFFFVERSVNDEYETYLKNLEQSESIQWRFVDSVEVFRFIQFVRSLPSNNAMFPFETSNDLMSKLREQLAGLFQGILQRRRGERYDSNVNKLIESVEALDRVVSYLREEKRAEKRVMDDLLFSRHPAFAELQRALELKIRILFEDWDELEAIFDHFGFQRVDPKELEASDRDNYFFWSNSRGPRKLVGVGRDLFEEEPGGEGEGDPAKLRLRKGLPPELSGRELVVVR